MTEDIRNQQNPNNLWFKEHRRS